VQTLLLIGCLYFCLLGSVLLFRVGWVLFVCIGTGVCILFGLGAFCLDHMPLFGLDVFVLCLYWHSIFITVYYWNPQGLLGQQVDGLFDLDTLNKTSQTADWGHTRKLDKTTCKKNTTASECHSMMRCAMAFCSNECKCCEL